MTRQERKILEYDPDVNILYESLLNRSLHQLSGRQAEIAAYALECAFPHCRRRRKGFEKFQKLAKRQQQKRPALPAALLDEENQRSFNQQGRAGKSRRMKADPAQVVSRWRGGLLALAAAVAAVTIFIIRRNYGM